MCVFCGIKGPLGRVKYLASVMWDKVAFLLARASLRYDSCLKSFSCCIKDLVSDTSSFSSNESLQGFSWKLERSPRSLVLSPNQNVYTTKITKRPHCSQILLLHQHHIIAWWHIGSSLISLPLRGRRSLPLPEAHIVYIPREGKHARASLKLTIVDNFLCLFWLQYKVLKLYKESRTCCKMTWMPAVRLLIHNRLQQCSIRLLEHWIGSPQPMNCFS